MEQQTQIQTKDKREKAGVKLLVISLLCLLLLIPWFLIKITITERNNTETAAEKEVYSKWGVKQTVTGPAIRVNINKEEGDIMILPETLTISSDASTRTLNRGIYDFTVYDANIVMTGEFILPNSLTEKQLNKLSLNCWKMETRVSSLKGLTDNPTVKINGRCLEQHNVTFDGSSIIWPVNIEPLMAGGKLQYEIIIPVRGSNTLQFVPSGNTTTVKMHSNCATPSFCGNFLPTERNVTKEGFDAEWKVLAINRGFSQVLDGPSWDALGNESYDYLIEETTTEAAFGVNLKKPVEQYQQNERAVKYAYLIVLLTFGIVFLIEVRRERPIHPAQYLLIGIAIMLFYTLLLSFSEHLSFLVAYIIASIMTVTLIAFYLGSIMHDKKVGLIFAGVLTTCYLFIYILLQIESYALLVGSIGLFAILAAAMTASRKVEWYKS